MLIGFASVMQSETSHAWTVDDSPVKDWIRISALAKGERLLNWSDLVQQIDRGTLCVDCV